MWSVISSKIVLADKWIRVRADDCRMPSGRAVAPYYVLEYPDFVHVLAVTPDDRIVLVRQYRHGLGDMTLELPGGVMDAADAGPADAGMRELAEETGFTAASHRLAASLSSDPAKFNNRTHLVIATSASQTLDFHLDETEEIEVVLVCIQEALELLKAGKFINAAHAGLLMFGLLELGRLTVKA